MIQDDAREKELVRIFNLEWDEDHQRDGVDAYLDVEVDGAKYRFDIEVKSTTGSTVSTARDVGMEHIKKWRSKIFVIGYYTPKPKGGVGLGKCLCLTPLDMESWISTIEKKIGIDFRIAELAAKRLELDDLYEVCGKQDTYSMEDAKRLHKQQWSAEEYKAALDATADGKPRISPGKMLEILRLRSKYISERGSTLNNPHITAAHLRQFEGTDREIKSGSWAASIRKIAEDFVRANPGHAAAAAIDDTPIIAAAAKNSSIDK